MRSNNCTYNFLFVLFIMLSVSLNNTFAQNPLPQRFANKIKTYEKLGDSFLRTGNHNKAALYYNKIAYIYWEHKSSDKAIEFFNKSLTSNEKIGNKNAIWAVNNNIGMIFSDLEKYDEALKYFNKSLEISKQMGEKSKIASSLKNISLSQQYLNKNTDAIKTLEEALRYSHELNNLRLIRSCYGALSEINKKIGNDKESIKNYELYSTFDKKIKAEEMIQVKQESRAKVLKANAEKREKELELELERARLKSTQDSLDRVELLNNEKQQKIDLLNKEKEIKAQQDQIKMQRLIISLSVGGAILFLIFIILILFQYRQKHKAYKKIELQNAELLEQKRIIEEKNTQLNAKNIEIGEKNNKLAERNKVITDSIHYASMIQEAILPSRMALQDHFPDSFIYYRPRDIVSGDFYWFAKHGKKKFIAAVDCTGHSVPGAFMSMIGNTLLNEIVNEKKIHTPSEILLNLNTGILKSLKQNIESENEDGMDISLCCIDTEHNKIEFAAAGHSIYVVTENNFKVIEGDIFSIGDIFSRRDDVKFTNHIEEINSQTSLYFFSDGYPDQFGGKKNKKFMAENFKEVIKSFQGKEMHMQEQIIAETFDNWKNGNPQTDDVLVIGLRVNS